MPLWAAFLPTWKNYRAWRQALCQRSRPLLPSTKDVRVAVQGATNPRRSPTRISASGAIQRHKSIPADRLQKPLGPRRNPPRGRWTALIYVQRLERMIDIFERFTESRSNREALGLQVATILAEPEHDRSSNDRLLRSILERETEAIQEAHNKWNELTAAADALFDRVETQTEMTDFELPV